jgi:acyl-ACP thioesterase
VFTLAARPGLADCAPSGRARLDAIARWLQDVAYADVEDAGVVEEAVWVLRRARIRVERFPRFAERLSLHTFCSGTGRAWAERRTTVNTAGRSEPDIEAVSLWVHLSAVDWRPAPFSEKELAVYGPTAGARRVSQRLRHPSRPPPEANHAASWTFRATETDVADHVNNAAYWAPLEHELLSGDQPDPAALDVEIEFRTPAQPGEKVVLRSGEWRWIVSEDGEVHASILIAR